MRLFVFFFAATGYYSILAGQHVFSACKLLREQFALNNETIPEWCMSFRVYVIDKALGEDLDLLQKIAGILQGQSRTVTALTFSQTMIV